LFVIDNNGQNNYFVDKKMCRISLVKRTSNKYRSLLQSKLPLLLIQGHIIN